MSTGIRLRLSAVQMSVIWPGLDLLVKSYVAKRDTKHTLYEFPFRVYPPPKWFDRGKSHPYLMEGIIDLRERLLPKARVGGRVQMNAIDVRAAIYSVRVNLSYWRKERHDKRHWSHELKKRYELDAASFDLLKVRSERVIRSLERHMKRANRSLLKSATRDGYAAIMSDWKAHLRWMHLHIAYFKPLPPVIRGRKTRYQQILDALVLMANRAIQNDGYVPPESRELRKMMRLYVRSVRRGRETYSIRFLLDNFGTLNAAWHLARFVLQRLTLKELPQR
jgi:hypothetical protein